MEIFATLEADFQGAREYARGGIGPLFRERRLEEPYRVWELLSRTAVALGGLGITDVVAIFAGEEEIELEDEDPDDPSDDVRPEELADEVRRAYGDGEPESFLLMYTHEQPRFSHVITVEAAIDHPFDEAGLSVLVRATPLASGEELEAIDEEEREEALSAAMIEGADPAYEYDEDADPGGELYGAVQDFIRAIQGALNKELALDQPDVEIWYEEESGLPHADPGPMPGLHVGTHG
jgi:hypothetical protein